MYCMSKKSDPFNIVSYDIIWVKTVGNLLLCQTENITFIYLTGLPTFVILTKTEKVSSGNVTGV